MRKPNGIGLHVDPTRREFAIVEGQGQMRLGECDRYKEIGFPVAAMAYKVANLFGPSFKLRYQTLSG